MSFTSLNFAIFVLISTFFYYILPKKFQPIILLLVSLLFYATNGIKTIGWLFIVIFLTYFTGIILGKLNIKRDLLDNKDEKKKIQDIKKKIITINLILIFSMLFSLKYLDFTLELVGVLKRFDFLMPLGLSFFIFQSAGYTIDIYRNKYEPQTNLLKYALFVSFFPQIIQGPIARYNTLSKTLLSQNKFDYDNIKAGLQQILAGYLKKLVIADRCSLLVSKVIIENTPYGGAVITLGMLFYSLQLYCDFSGGINIASGVARLFGVKLDKNFNNPIFSTSVADFWRRWHITLGSFMKDYVFYSISLSKPFGKLSKWARNKFKGTFGKIFATSIATFIVYFLIGIWHGANFRYITFGFYNGIIITSSLILDKTYTNIKAKLKINDKSLWFTIFRIIRTNILVFFGRFLTRAPRLLVAFSLIKSVLLRPRFYELFDGTLFNFLLTKTDYIIIILGSLTLFLIEFYQEFIGDISKRLEKNAILDFLFILIPLVIILIFGIYREGYISSEFIYQQF